ncbi:MAG TPA: DUF3500 domain-containing protein [Vicinamibacterales bacterium]|nr:DUF3500 domain-containing protein [Vicinamibacterales bacterium]
MRSITRIAWFVAIALGVFAAVTATGLAQRSATAPRPAAGAAAEATARIVAAAQAVLTSLDEAGRAKVQFPYDSPQKTKWSNFPSGIFQREGVRLADLNPAQRAAIDTLLSTALSADGYRKVKEIMKADGVLASTQGQGRGGAPAGPPPGAGPPPADGPPPGAGGPPPGAGGPPQGGGRGRGGRGGGGSLRFAEDEYFLAFLGTPSVTAPWMLQFGGHHLAINLTLSGSQASMAPSLPAAQPAIYTVEGRTIRPLGKENDKAFELINALTDEQRKEAIIGSRVADLVLGPGQDGRTIQPEGIRASKLTPAHQALLLEIVREWAGIQHAAFAEPRMAEIRSALGDTFFAWSGPTVNGSAAYFRIQGPTLVIEYAPQGGVDHIHTIYRDPTNDYGAKFTKK